MLAVTSTSVWYTMRATGIVALVLLTATMVLGILTAGRTSSPSWPAFARADLHKRVSLLAMVFLAVHVLTAVLDTYVAVGWSAAIVPFASSYRPLWTGLGTVGVDLMVAVGVSSALRQRISPRTWRGIHWLAYGSWPVAMAHALGMGTDASAWWMAALAALCTAAVAAALTWRISDHRHHRRLGDRLGATTRAVAPRRSAGPSRIHPDPETRPCPSIRRPPASGSSRGIDHEFGDDAPCRPTVGRIGGDDPVARPGHPSGHSRPPGTAGTGRPPLAGGHVAGRGRLGPGRAGGAGFPSGVKWDAVRRSGRAPIVVVNVLEGEPASAKDRVLSTYAPHLVLDGAEVAAKVVGASEIVVAVADHNGTVAASFEVAVGERRAGRRAGLPISVVRPPGGYVTGEESALVSWLNDRPARPFLRVDKSVPLRVGRRSVVVHNAETLSQVALIARHGPQWFRSVGAPDAPGSTLVTVTRRRPPSRGARGRAGHPGDRHPGAGRTGRAARRRVGGRLRRCVASSVPSRHAVRTRTPGRGRRPARGGDSHRTARGCLRYRRDGSGGPVHVGGERGPVRTLRLRAPRHRRRPRATVVRTR